MERISFPGGLVATVTSTYGDAGARWLRDLPALIADLERLWSLRAGPPFAALSYHYVAPALHDGGVPAVLKIGVANADLALQIQATRALAGPGMIRLLDADPERGALLLERADPGDSLGDTWDASRDDAATDAAASVMRLLRRPVPSGGESVYPSAATWGAGLSQLREHFDGGCGPFPAGLVDRAERLQAELLASQPETALLHGDLHHGNILSTGGGQWIAIDPKGVIGEPAYETGALLRNPMPRIGDTAGLRRLLWRRIARLAEALEMDPERIRGWAIAGAVLSAWWSFEDHGGGWESAIACAEAMSAPP